MSAHSIGSSQTTEPASSPQDYDAEVINHTQAIEVPSEDEAIDDNDEDWVDESEDTGSSSPILHEEQPAPVFPHDFGYRGLLLDALDKGNGSCLFLWCLFPHMVALLEESARHITVNCTVKDMSDGEIRVEMMKMLMAVPEQLLRSVIRGSVAHDLYNGAIRSRDNQYPVDTGGVYVVALSIDMRNGCFLTSSEIRTLIDYIDKYVDAWDKWADANKTWNSADKRHRDFISQIDNIYGKPNTNGQPKYISGLAGRQGVVAMKDMFERMVLEDDMDSPLTQSPLMVGCNGAKTTTIQDRAECHKNVRSTTKTYALTLAIIQHMRLKCKVHVLTVLPTWCLNQLPLARSSSVT